MSNTTPIEWTDSTWNPVTGCTKISAGCDFCYAERIAERFRGVPGHPFESGFDLTLRPERLKQPLQWLRPRMIFVNSMSDLFHKGIPDAFVDSVFETMEMADWHIYQVLTKRSSRMRDYVNRRYGRTGASEHRWLGVSIEDGNRLSRLKHLQCTEARVRFLSLEPLIGEVGTVDLQGIHWVIAGGESGPRARPTRAQWVREIREQCVIAGVPFFFKQWGGLRPKSGGRALDGREWNQWPRLEGLATNRGKVVKRNVGLMVAPRDTVWKLEPHTRAKHAILRRYLQAWMVILSQGKFPEILYIDGFSDPGEYKGGEVGSPVIALETAIGYSQPLSAKVNFLFVEKDEARANHLRDRISRIEQPPHFNVVIEGGASFEDAFEKHYSNFLRPGRGLVPAFAFIDLFGWTGAPFEIVKKIMSHRSCEVLVNFMYEEVNRHLRHPDQVANFNSFFGTTEWNNRPDHTSPRERNRWLHDLYMRQMQSAAGVRYVRSFEMFNDRNITDYFLFYGTNELLGLKKMKEAMWKVDETGEFKFSDATDPNQFVLFEKRQNLAILQQQVVKEYIGRNVSLGEIEDFVVVKTAFRETHYKGVLKLLEATGALDVVQARRGRKKGTFADSDMIVRLTHL